MVGGVQVGGGGAIINLVGGNIPVHIYMYPSTTIEGPVMESDLGMTLDVPEVLANDKPNHLGMTLDVPEVLANDNPNQTISVWP